MKQSLYFLLLILILNSSNIFGQNGLKVTHLIKNKQILIKENFKITVQTKDTTIKGRYTILNDSTIQVNNKAITIYDISKLICSHIKARKIGIYTTSICGTAMLVGGIVDIATKPKTSDVGFRHGGIGVSGILSVYPLITSIGLLSAHHRFNFNKNWLISIVQFNN